MSHSWDAPHRISGPVSALCKSASMLYQLSQQTAWFAWRLPAKKIIPNGIHLVKAYFKKIAPDEKEDLRRGGGIHKTVLAENSGKGIRALDRSILNDGGDANEISV